MQKVVGRRGGAARLDRHPRLVEEVEVGVLGRGGHGRGEGGAAVGGGGNRHIAGGESRAGSGVHSQRGVVEGLRAGAPDDRVTEQVTEHQVAGNRVGEQCPAVGVAAAGVSRPGPAVEAQAAARALREEGGRHEAARVVEPDQRIRPAPARRGLALGHAGEPAVEVLGGERVVGESGAGGPGTLHPNGLSLPDRGRVGGQVLQFVLVLGELDERLPARGEPLHHLRAQPLQIVLAVLRQDRQVFSQRHGGRRGLLGFCAAHGGGHRNDQYGGRQGAAHP